MAIAVVPSRKTNPWTYVFGTAAQVQGEVRIENNQIDGGAYPANLHVGIIPQTLQASVVIRGNEIRNFASGAVLGRYLWGGLVVADNLLTPGYVPQGIGGWYGMGLGLSGLYGGAVSVTRNLIQCAHPLADGISIENNSGNPSPIVIEKNDIEMLGTTHGALLASGLSETLWKSNTVTGTMNWAISIKPMNTLGSTGNVFQANNIARVIPASSDAVHVLIAAGADFNRLIGFSGDVIDGGTGNVINGARE